MSHGVGRTDVGRRGNNEDSFAARDDLGLYVVADGVGGQEGGEVASRLAVDTLVGFFDRAGSPELELEPWDTSDCTVAERRAELAIRMCQREVIRCSQGDLSMMATTLALVLVRDGRALLAHVGDSRIYRQRDGLLEQMTRDHSLFAELEAAGAGYIAHRLTGQLSAMITRSIAKNADATPDIRVEDVRPGDRFLLCSDGVSDVLEDDDLAHLLDSSEPEAASAAIVHRAWLAGSHDNITAVVVAV